MPAPRHLEGPPGSPKLFLAPAKGGRAPTEHPPACWLAGGAWAPAKVDRERAVCTLNALWRHCVVVVRIPNIGSFTATSFLKLPYGSLEGMLTNFFRSGREYAEQL